MKAALELIWTGSYGATTVDGICEKAGVKKGSFYHFFDSIADLTITALEMDWEARRFQLDVLFSPTVHPLKRLTNYCHALCERQSQLRNQCGRVLGCLFFSLGAEIGTQEEMLRVKIQEILDHHVTYLESAIREAQSAGLITVSDPSRISRILFTYYEGLLTRARILNDAEILKEMIGVTQELLGAKKTQVPMA